MHFQIYNLPKKSYIIYISKYIISLLNNISFNSKNIFQKKLLTSHAHYAIITIMKTGGVNNEHNQTEKNIRIARKVA